MSGCKVLSPEETKDTISFLRSRKAKTALQAAVRVLNRILTH